MVYSKETCLFVEREKPCFLRDTFSNVEQVGYVTVEQQVMSMLVNGERLMSFKRMAYDYPDGNVDLDAAIPDPTLDVGFDPADASYYQSQLASKLRKVRAEKKAHEEVKPSDEVVDSSKE